jgi:ATP-dependent DNA ligase
LEHPLGFGAPQQHRIDTPFIRAPIAEHLGVGGVVLDGKIACVDDAGRPVFRDLLFRKRQCVFIAFDLLYLNGKDLRTLPLIERKAR